MAMFIKFFVGIFHVALFWFVLLLLFMVLI